LKNKVIESPSPPEGREEARAQELGVPFVTLNSATVDEQIVDVIPEETARRLGVMALFRVENSLSVAMVDPTDVLALDELRRLTGFTILPSLCTDTDLQEAIARWYRVDAQVRRVAESIPKEEEEAAEAHRIDAKDETFPIVNLVNMILLQAVRDGASDIHVEPDRDLFRVRYRVDGALREISQFSLELLPALVSRIKTMSGMDIAEKRIPQDGSMVVRTERRRIDLRVSSLPTVAGEKIVLRILDQNSIRLDISKLGLPAAVESAWRRLIRSPDGVVLVTGPTGSGKTSTLYATLAELNSVDRNILTVEDPVEYNLPIINQVQVREKVNLTFASVLRSILRQDPDIIMIGEVRDQETAEIAIRAALTGHLVLSTLHTNDSVSAVTRLSDMGIPAYLLASSIRGVLAQRLVRKTCLRCRREVEPDPDLCELINLSEEEREGLKAFRGEGCRECGYTGYRGRTGLYELFAVSRSVSRVIARNGEEEELAHLAHNEGSLHTLREDGIRKATEGSTSLEEVARITRAVWSGRRKDRDERGKRGES